MIVKNIDYMEGFSISMYRRFGMDESRDSVLRGLLRGVEWVREQPEAIGQLHMGRHVMLRELGLVAVGFVTEGGHPAWRVMLESKARGGGLVMLEVTHGGVGVLAWMRQLHAWLTDGCYEEHLRLQEQSYRKRLRGSMARVCESDSWVTSRELCGLWAESLAPIVGEYLSVVSLLNYFGSDATHRKRYQPSKFNIPCSDHYMAVMGKWFYEPWSEMVGTSQPEETIAMVTFLRLTYESVYRKLVKVSCGDWSEDDLRYFTERFEECLLSSLRSDDLVWGNSILPQFMSYMVGCDVNVDGTPRSVDSEVSDDSEDSGESSGFVEVSSAQADVLAV